MSGHVTRFYDFGPFRIDASQHLLLRYGIEIPLTPKAFDTLLLLVRNNGKIVEKDELLRAIWPNAFVEEATLAQNIFTIRKALGGSEGDQYIQTIPKRGYRFVASVAEVKVESADVRLDDPGTPSLTRVDERDDRASPIYSIAVLPLINQSANLNVEHLSDCVTESLTNSLALISQLHVKACSTGQRYKGSETDLQQAGHELGVSALLTGRLLQVNDNVIVRMELVDTANGWQLWGQEYTQKLSDIHKLQEDITRDFSENLRLKLTGEAWKQLAKSRSENAEAYQFYLKGRSLLKRRTKEGYKQAIDYFEQAIEIDPSLSLA